MAYKGITIITIRIHALSINRYTTCFKLHALSVEKKKMKWNNVEITCRRAEFCAWLTYTYWSSHCCSLAGLSNEFFPSVKSKCAFCALTNPSIGIENWDWRSQICVRFRICFRNWISRKMRIASSAVKNREKKELLVNWDRLCCDWNFEH